MDSLDAAATKAILQENPSFYMALMVSCDFFIALSLVGIPHCKHSIKGLLIFMAVALINLFAALGTLYVCAYWLKGLKISIVYCLKFAFGRWKQAFIEYLTYYLLLMDTFSSRRMEQVFATMFIWYYISLQMKVFRPPSL